jgi:hypothetical protein
MRNNVFQFGNSWWLQNMGTAMGTPCACIYATLFFFAWYEQKKILTKYRNNLIVYCRQIDNIFGIWKPDSNNPNRFKEFKNNLNSYCKLDWNTEDLSDTIDFLDLTISLKKEGNTITYKTFQKPMNLFLYIPGHSAHPPGVLKSLIFGLIQTYYRQNKENNNFRHNVKLLFKQLLQQGHSYEVIHPVFVKAAKTIDNCLNHKRNTITRNTTIHKQKNNKNKPRTDIFFHLPFHCKDVSRKIIQETYHQTCKTADELGESFKRMKTESGSTMKISQLTMAYSRGRNLHDTLCSSTLKDLEGCNVLDFI